MNPGRHTCPEAPPPQVPVSWGVSRATGEAGQPGAFAAGTTQGSRAAPGPCSAALQRSLTSMASRERLQEISNFFLRICSLT